jgi:hypothetical protein
VELQGNRFVISGTRKQNALFLTTGIVTECFLVKPTESSKASANAPPGALVRRIKVIPFCVEFERAAAYFGNFLDIQGTQEFGGPIYASGLAFTTRKEGTASMCE